MARATLASTPGVAGRMRSDPALPHAPVLLRRTLLAGTVVAVGDMTHAIATAVFALRVTTVRRVLQSPASGLLGPAAFQGGAATVALGLVVHTLVALCWTGLFLFALLRWPRLRRWTATPAARATVGLVYGVLVWLLMDGVVLPLSRARVTSPLAPWFWIQLVMHPLVVGLPIATLLGRPAAAHTAMDHSSSSAASGVSATP